MKRIQLTHGSARVEDDCSPETIKALDELSKIAYEKADEIILKKKPKMITDEIRIGSVVTLDNEKRKESGQFVKVVGITESSIRLESEFDNEFGQKPCYIKAVDISGAYLKRFGFIETYGYDGNTRQYQIDDDAYTYITVRKAMPNIPTNRIWSVILQNDDGGAWELRGIYFLHELQNIYRIVKGRELKFDWQWN